MRPALQSYSQVEEKYRIGDTEIIIVDLRCLCYVNLPRKACENGPTRRD